MKPFIGYLAASIAFFVIASLLIFRNRRRLRPTFQKILQYIYNTCRFLQYEQIIARHRYLGPWSAAGVLLHLIYFSVNLLVALYPPLSVTTLSAKAGIAAIINIAFLYCSINVDFIAELLGVTPKTWRYLHRAAAWMVGALTILHVTCALLSHGQSLRTSRISSISGFVVILTVLAASIDPLKRLTRALASKFHLLLALVVIAAICTHVIVEIGVSWEIFIIPICFCILFVGDASLFLYRNGIFGVQGWTWVSFIRLADNTTQVNLHPGRPVHVSPGQYIKLWVPVSGKKSWHFRQYHVQSWGPTGQPQIKLFDLPDGYISTSPEVNRIPYLRESEPHRAFFTGPYGLHQEYTQYETIFVIIHDYGLLSVYAQLQYIYHCIENRTSKARRVLLVWQWESVPKEVYNIPEIEALEVEIREELEKFSKKVGLDRTVMEFHLGRYTPPEKPDRDHLQERETEKEELERLVREYIVYDKENDSEITMLQKQALKLEIDRVQEQIEPLQRRIDNYAAQKSILKDVLMWINHKLKKEIENFAPQCNVYVTLNRKTYGAGRAKIIAETADVKSIFEEEIINYRERIADDPPETRGRFLIMVSGPPSLHELAHDIAGGNLGDVDLKEFQYVPGHRF